MFCYGKYDHCAAREEVHNKTCPWQSLIQYHVLTKGFGVGASKMLNSVLYDPNDPTRADFGKQTIALNRKQMLK